MRNGAAHAPGLYKVVQERFQRVCFGVGGHTVPTIWSKLLTKCSYTMIVTEHPRRLDD